MTGCTSVGNHGRGIAGRWWSGDPGIPFHCSLTNCAVSGNGKEGIYAGEHWTITNCSANYNTLDGISLQSGCTAIGCTANGNARDGIRARIEGTAGIVRNCTIKACTASSNSGGGVNAESSANILDCTASDNHAVGIEANDGSTIDRCIASRNWDEGIEIYFRCAVRNCVVERNREDGIYVNGAYNSVTNNDVHMNGDETVGAAGGGASVGTGIRLYGSGFDQDGQVVEPQSSDNRIDGNHVTQNDLGIVISQPTSARNIIVRNMCVNNRSTVNLPCPQLTGR